jgi:prephenate dehydrogenase
MLLARRVSIIGVGLIGGSLARALRKAGAVGEIVGIGRDETRLRAALDLGVVDRISTDLSTAADADIVVLAAPVGITASLLKVLKPVLGPSTIVTDVGSTKGSVIAAAESVFGKLPGNFVPGHPIAGTEQQGVEASTATLFQNRKVILTPVHETNAEATGKVRRMWELAGAQVIEMSAGHHDEVLAATSHLPHLLAYALVDCLAAMEERREIFAYAAGGFRDFTRIASSSPEMWRDIVCANQAALLPVLDGYIRDLEKLRGAIAAERADELLAVFARAKAARDRFIDQAGSAGSTPSEDA